MLCWLLSIHRAIRVAVRRASINISHTGPLKPFRFIQTAMGTTFKHLAVCSQAVAPQQSATLTLISCGIAGPARRSPLGCPATRFASRRHDEPEQAREGVLQHRCGRFNVYGLKALPEPQTHRIWSAGDRLVSVRRRAARRAKLTGAKSHRWAQDLVFWLCKPTAVRERQNISRSDSEWGGGEGALEHLRKTSHTLQLTVWF